jgi:hypothetical protein
MYDIRITKIGPIVTEPRHGARAAAVSIEIFTDDGPKALELSPAVAMELAATIVRHLREEGALAEQAKGAAAGPDGES